MKDFPRALQVYLVEDSEIILRLLVATVEAAGAELIGHTNQAQKAIAELSQLSPDLILIDVALSSGTGCDVLNALQASGHARSAIKVILTNHANAEYRELSFRLGATHFFDKSSEGWQALELINKMAAERRCGRPGAPDPDCRDPTGRRH